MKKLLVTILSIIYLTTTTGFTLNMHYCMGKLVDLATWADTDKCSNCGMEKSVAKDSGCCTDEYKQIKLDCDQKSASVAHTFIQLSFATLPLSFIKVPSHTLTPVTKHNPVSKAPLRGSSIAVYINNCVFLI
ncbi:MAG: hypothetical protein WKF91_21365 [Segetibacter sp.]